MKVIYIAKWNAWYVTEVLGNKVIYHGPFYQERHARWYFASLSAKRLESE